MPEYPEVFTQAPSDKHGERPSVLAWIPDSLRRSIRDGSNVTDLQPYLQAAEDTISARGGGYLEYPWGTYLTSAITAHDHVYHVGKYGQGTSVLKAIAPGTAIFTWDQIDDTIWEGLTFEGVGGKAFFQTDLSFYTSTCRWAHCHFSAELAEGIYGNLVLCEMEFCRFGLFGTAGANSRHVYSKGSLTGPKASNINRFHGSRFYHCAGGESIRFEAGYMVHFTECNIERNDGAKACTFKGMFGVTFHKCWFEQNAGSYAVSFENDSGNINGNYIIDFDGTWIDLSHAGNLYAIYLDGASQYVDMERCGGVIGSTQFITHYNGVGNDFGIRKYRRNTWLAGGFSSAYSRQNIHDEMGAIFGDGAQLTGASQSNKIVGKLSLGFDRDAVLQTELIVPINDGFRFYGRRGKKTVVSATSGAPVSLQVTGHGYATGQTILVESVDPNINGERSLTVVDTDNFTLDGTSATVTYVSGGTVDRITIVAQILNISQGGEVSLYNNDEKQTMVLRGDTGGGGLFMALKNASGTVIGQLDNTGVFYPQQTTSGFYANSGTPETVVTANVGSFCIALDGSGIYYKATGSGNTGWIKLALLPIDIVNDTTGILTILRGGTGASTSAGAITNLGAAAAANTYTKAQVDSLIATEQGARIAADSSLSSGLSTANSNIAGLSSSKADHGTYVTTLGDDSVAI